jgi:hypothetical protein
MTFTERDRKGMPRKKHEEVYAVIDDKYFLHPYELQQLVGTRFVSVANRILTGRLSLINLRPLKLTRLPWPPPDEHPWDSVEPSPHSSDLPAPDSEHRLEPLETGTYDDEEAYF